MNNKTQKSLLFLTRSGIIAALYTALTYLSFLFGLASGPVQFRLSEALCILPVFLPEATVGLTVGCLISNLITGGHILDIVFGTLATAIGAFGTQLLGKIKRFPFVLYTLPSILSNGLIVPFVLCYTLNGAFTHAFFWPTVGSVSLGEGAVCLVLGSLLYLAIRKRPKILGL